MRLEVAAWESSFLEWRTDDERSTCAFRCLERSAKVLFCGDHVLGGCTDETSAYAAGDTGARKMLCGEYWTVGATFVMSSRMDPAAQHGA